MLHRLCGPPSIPLSFSLAAVLPRRNAYWVSCGTRRVIRLTPSIHSLRHGTTGVSNPVCSPSFCASASEQAQVAAFATGVPPDIYAFHRYTGNSTTLYLTQDLQYQGRAPSGARIFQPRLTSPPTHALRPVIPNNARPLRLTAAAGT